MHRLLIGLTLAAWTTLAAAATPERPYVGGVATHLTPSDVRDADAEEAGYGLQLGWPLADYPGWAVELGAYANDIARDDGSGDDRLYQVGIDVLRYWSPGERWAPFVLSGLSAAREEIRGQSFTNPALGLGAGLLWRPGGTRLGLRLDLRALAQENDYQEAGRPSSGRSLLVDGRLGLGLTWIFERRRAAAACPPGGCPPPDEDGDGVPDPDDLCPRTASDASVDATGCTPAAPRDNDGDGVANERDRCPGTPPGETVDDSGCGEQDAVLLSGVSFDFDSDRLTADARRILARVAVLLQGGLRDIRVEIAGHTDAIGSDDYNRALSARRAYAVKRFLVEEGVSAGRLVSTGYGASRPVASNASEEGRAQNRRVVFRVLDRTPPR